MSYVRQLTHRLAYELLEMVWQLCELLFLLFVTHCRIIGLDTFFREHLIEVQTG